MSAPLSQASVRHTVDALVLLVLVCVAEALQRAQLVHVVARIVDNPLRAVADEIVQQQKRLCAGFGRCTSERAIRNLASADRGPEKLKRTDN